MMQNKSGFVILLPLLGLVTFFSVLVRVLIDQRVDTGSILLLSIGALSFAVFVGLRLRRLPSHLMPLTRGIGYVILLLALLVSANLLSSKVFFRLDLTELRGYSLSEQTLNSLSELAQPILISAFLRSSDYRSQLAEKLFSEYADHSPWITFEIIDPDIRPSVMQQKGISNYGTLLFEQGPKRIEINSVDEQSITSAIIRLSDERPQSIYFSTGYGERDIESAQRTGYKLLAWYLKNKEGYVLKTVNFSASSILPEDMDILVIASPRSPFSDNDEGLVAQYLEDGGRLLILLDAGLPNPLPRLLTDWGILVGENLIFDPENNYFGDAATPLVNRYAPSSITRPLQGMNTFFPVAREVEASETVPEGLLVRSLAKTSSQSWAESDLEDSQASFSLDEDKQGPISLAVSVQASLATGRGAKAAKARLVVFGDSDFVSNAALSSTDADLGNALFFINAANWLIEDESLISLLSIDTEVRTVVLSAKQMRLVAYTTILFAPLIIALAGAIVWWKRRS